MKDGHGDVIKVLDASGIPVSYYKYDAYGKQIESEGTLLNPYRYTGEYFDEESGLIYLRARYYSPEIMRFITEDTYTGSLNNPLSLNLYGYCHGNPIMNIDPSGHFTMMLNKVGEKVYIILMAFIYYISTTMNEFTLDNFNTGFYGGMESTGDSYWFESMDLNLDIYEGLPPFSGDGPDSTFVVDMPTDAANFLDGLKDFRSGILDAKEYIMTAEGTGHTKEGNDAQDCPGANGKITGYTQHGNDQAEGRDGGRGVSEEAINDTVNNPNKVVVQHDAYGLKYKYVSDKAVVILNKAGKVVTTYAKGSKWWR